jgi:2-polyprenyl-6-methoxyphenol hydroxylase-like FAD-dependent oxidoreductase
MPGGGRTVYIAGAGIAGLTLALALAKFGATVVVLERNDAVQEVGAGLQISPNARRVLNQLGLDRQVASHSFEPEGIDLYGFGGAAPIITLTLGATIRGRFGVPYAVMHRADLAEILYRACRRFANIDMVFGVRNFDAATHARGVSVGVEEAGGKTRNARGFAFVGADGVNSATRLNLLDGAKAEVQARVAWRALLDLDALGTFVAKDRTSVLFGPGFHAVCYPLPHRGKLNVVLFAAPSKVPGRGGAPAATPDLGRQPDARFAAILAAVGDTWTYWPLATVSADDWHHGGIGLIGDAAHAMLPFQAQGAAMAIEDAAILAPLLMTEPRAEQAFERFVALRRPRVDRVMQVSGRNGAAFHLRWPLSRARDVVLRIEGPEAHLKRLAWLYGYDAAPDIEPKAPPRPAAPSHVEREHRH